MDRIINAKTLRASLPRIVERVWRGERFTVRYRSRPALRLVPVTDEALAEVPLEQDPLYRAEAVGTSSDGRSSEDHDEILYGPRR
jgi:antitoxin (DNA-binding transcriptional repressor) of toxin-antitoxin stability system